MAAPPRYRPKRGDLGTDGKVQESGKVVRLYWVDQPAERDHSNAGGNDADNVVTGRPRQGPERWQDGGILGPVYGGWPPFTADEGARLVGRL